MTWQHILISPFKYRICTVPCSHVYKTYLFLQMPQKLPEVYHEFSGSSCSWWWRNVLFWKFQEVYLKLCGSCFWHRQTSYISQRRWRLPAALALGAQGAYFVRWAPQVRTTSALRYPWSFPEVFWKRSKLTKCGHGSPGPVFIFWGAEDLYGFWYASSLRPESKTWK